eukprot:1619556-Alexandrium_andersonii.AAC.1
MNARESKHSDENANASGSDSEGSAVGSDAQRAQRSACQQPAKGQRTPCVQRPRIAGGAI